MRAVVQAVPARSGAAGARAWHSAAMAVIHRAAQETSWHDIPGVRILGAVIGTLLLVAALRAMFGRRR